MRRGSRRAGSREPEELNVTTFMNLMVVLIPFLLLSAAFSEITVHDLNLPALSETSHNDPLESRKLELEVVIRKDSLDVLDRNSGRLKLIPATKGGHDFAALREKMLQIKNVSPQTSTVTLLLEPAVSYEALVKTMDIVRSTDDPADGKKKIDLFPDVSIGDAPIVEAVGVGQ